MKVIDFHPDGLLDREIEGTLSADDERRLGEHLERCAQCRLERQLRSDFETELGTREDGKSIQLFVSGAIKAALPRPPPGTLGNTRRGGTSQRRASSRPSRFVTSSAWRRRFMVLLAATMVLATGIAAAHVELAGRAWTAAREKIVFMFRASSPERSASKAAPPAAKGRAIDAIAAEAILPAETAELPLAHVDPLAEAKTAPVDVRRISQVGSTARRGEGRALRAGAAVDAPVKVAEAPARVEETPIPAPSAQPPSRPRDTAAALFDDASTARRRGNIVEATALYRDLQARFPASAEARVSMAVVARMQLDIGETAAAASGFAAYLATGDRALREEAMAGRAVALGRLGRTRDESGAWRELMRAYPRSGYANIARARMERSPWGTPGGVDFP